MSELLRARIVSEIKRLAARNGQSPGSNLFRSETGIRETEWRGRFWSNWGNALEEAGCAPNEFSARLDSQEILKSVATLALQLGHVPTGSELMLLRRKNSAVPSPKTVGLHFRKEALLLALRELAEGEVAYASLLKLLPLKEEQGLDDQPTREGWVYLLGSGKFFKIGRSDSLERRIKEVGVALPEATILVHAIRTDDPPGIESYWHRRFADRRANGEWFKLSRVDLAAFKRRKFQ